MIQVVTQATTRFLMHKKDFEIGRRNKLVQEQFLDNSNNNMLDASVKEDKKGV